MLEGADVSSWQSATPTRGIAFLFVRACYGTMPDRMAATHISRAKAAGLVVGAYCFGRHGDVGGQVDALLRYGAGADLWALDLEADAGHPSMTLDEAAAFVRGMHAKGKRCGLYHSESGYPSVGQDWRWIANWTREPAIPYEFWQWTDSPYDRDRFAGSMEDLRKMTELTYPTTGTATATPSVSPTPTGPGWRELSTLWKAVEYLANALGYDITPTPGWVIPAASVYVQKQPEPAASGPEPVAPSPEPAAPSPEPAVPSPEPAVPSPEPAAEAEAASPPLAEDVLREGETLYTFAQRVLGDGARWPDIMNANADRIVDPATLEPGTSLRLPHAQ